MGYSIDPHTSIGQVHLQVNDLAGSVAFYETSLGLTVQGNDGRRAELGGQDGSPFLRLTGNTDARRVRRVTGLYHFAVLMPDRLALATALKRLVETRSMLQGASDHGVSLALYLADPDGNGIEIYADRPRDEWPLESDGTLKMISDPLDLRALLEEAGETGDGVPAGTRIGHVHLQVSDLAQSEAFHAGLLGFDVMQRWAGSALFLSAGGYHHHIGMNTWAGVGLPPAPPEATGLLWYRLDLPADARDGLLEHLRYNRVGMREIPEGMLIKDPSGIGVVISIDTAG